MTASLLHGSNHQYMHTEKLIRYTFLPRAAQVPTPLSKRPMTFVGDKRILTNCSDLYITTANALHLPQPWKICTHLDEYTKLEK